LEIYRLTKSFPEAERFGIISQFRRAAASVPTNIAEGTKHQGRQDYARFLNMAEGSWAETEYLLMLSRDLGYLAPKTSEIPLAETGEFAKMLNALRIEVEPAAPAKRQSARSPATPGAG
jgi:four helix bundle protein